MGAPTRKVFLYLHKLLDAPYLFNTVRYVIEVFIYRDLFK